MKNMTQKLFILSLAIIVALGLILAELETSGAFFIILALSSLSVFTRRHYLGLKPWWGGLLRDIPSYFKKP